MFTLERIKNLEKQVTILEQYVEGLVKLTERQKEQIDSMEYTVEDLQQTHRQYSDHMIKSSGCSCGGLG